jgi:hypothetical protein
MQAPTICDVDLPVQVRPAFCPSILDLWRSFCPLQLRTAGPALTDRPAVPGPFGGAFPCERLKIPVGQVSAEVREEKYAASDTNRKEKARDLQLFLG